MNKVCNCSQTGIKSLGRSKEKDKMKGIEYGSQEEKKEVGGQGGREKKIKHFGEKLI